jgi:hypothetical protein
MLALYPTSGGTVSSMRRQAGVLDGVLAAAWEKGLLKTAGRARTDSTHVRSAARELCWLEMVAETLRSALNTLAQAAPDWLAEVAEPDWFRHYATRAGTPGSPGPTPNGKRSADGSGRTGCGCLRLSSRPGHRLDCGRRSRSRSCGRCGSSTSTSSGAR